MKYKDIIQYFKYKDGTLWKTAWQRSDGKSYQARIVSVKNNTSTGYCKIGFNNKTEYYHRVVWILANGDIPDGFVIDHINGDKLDNRLENLRAVPHYINSNNKTHHRNGRLVGCWFDEKNKKWIVRPRIRDERFYVGLYETEHDAHTAYKNFLKEKGISV